MAAVPQRQLAQGSWPKAAVSWLKEAGLGKNGLRKLTLRLLVGDQALGLQSAMGVKYSGGLTQPLPLRSDRTSINLVDPVGEGQQRFAVSDDQDRSEAEVGLQ